MARIVGTTETGGEFGVTWEVDPDRDPPPDGWRRVNGAIQDSCRFEDLYVRNDVVDINWLWFDLEFPDKSLTQAQAIDAVVNLCRDKGVTAQPGQTLTVDGEWLFRGWQLSRS